MASVYPGMVPRLIQRARGLSEIHSNQASFSMRSREFTGVPRSARPYAPDQPDLLPPSPQAWMTEARTA